MVDPKNNVGIIVQDDGVGMDRRRLVGMLSFGFSDKEHKAGNVGRFGIGFKSGSMRLARDALILTKRDGYAHVAFLSQTFLDDAELDDILIPMFSWRMERDATTGGRVSYVASEPANTKKWDEHMSVILRYSFVPSEPQLMRELDKIRGSHGTRIVLFNLRDPPELDFTSYKDDIRLVGAIPDDERAVRGPIFQQSREGQQASIDVQEDYSLRAYMEILYLKPRCEFTLRGRPVVPRDPIAHLAREYYVFPEYKPRGLDAGITIHIGYAADETSKKCGFHIYNKNRLIRMHQRFGSQLQANTMMKDMIGVIEADSLEPTHNKQAFKEADITYQKFKRHLVQCMQDYYFGIQRYRLAGGGGRGAGTTSLKQTAKRRKRIAQSLARSTKTMTMEGARVRIRLQRRAVGRRTAVSRPHLPASSRFIALSWYTRTRTFSCVRWIRCTGRFQTTSKSLKIRWISVRLKNASTRVITTRKMSRRTPPTFDWFGPTR